MPSQEIESFRRLRQRAQDLAGTLVSDLRPFRHSLLDHGFLRKPDSGSERDDVNVTTTCSCLMALAQNGKLDLLYSDRKEDKVMAAGLFGKLMQAPWMSSGLAENNAFTTVLAIRTCGFLVEAGLLPSGAAERFSKLWETRIEFKDTFAFSERLVSADPVSKFLFSLFSKKAKNLISKFVAGEVDDRGIAGKLSYELERIVRTTSLFEEVRFRDAKLQKATLEITKLDLDGYSVARLNRLLLHEYYSDFIVPLENRSLSDIAVEISRKITNFKINDYPPTAAVIYWFVDGVDRAKISLPHEHWLDLCQWASTKFNQERSLVLARHDAMMDPVAMAMAACLCARLRLIVASHEPHVDKKGSLELLPSRQELEHSIHVLFKKQTSGIWPKYFPLFHYQEAGSNFCFTFELLEALLYEFGRAENQLIDRADFVEGLENAVEWCEENRLTFLVNGSHFCGWNSGGDLETLKKGQPESWATAVVHMFLWEVSNVLSSRIQKSLLRQYGARHLDHEKSTISSLLSIEIFEKGTHRDLNEVLKKEFVEKYGDESESSLRQKSKKAPRSALLFGPPGTSKTKVTEAISGELEWPLIQIDPSHFLENGLDGIYLQADRIFKDLMDLAGVVVLFDEMDALVQTRDSALKLDTAAQFLTTYMLPKLTALHDHGRILFFMATNFQERFDAAIKRTGRFDLLLCMGPPTLRAKLDNLHVFLGERKETKESKEAAKIISKFLKGDNWSKVQLELYTFGEFSSFIKALAKKEGGIIAGLKDTKKESFGEKVKGDSKYVGLRIDDLEPLSKHNVSLDDYKSVADLDKLKFSRKTFSSDAEITPVIRYLLDRRESKQQG